jgi:Ca2+-binding RTX toxin-like protein
LLTFLLVALGPSMLLTACQAGSAPTIAGGTGDDELRGSPRADTMRGFAGDDRMEGLGADDSINGMSGRDTLSATVSTGGRTRIVRQVVPA